MKKFSITIFSLISCICASLAQEKIIIVNEGSWQGDNGRLSYFADGKMVSNQWFRDVNGSKLGDGPNDIIAIQPNLLAIVVKESNLIQYIDTCGRALATTSDLPACRKMVSDGAFLYVTSYAHECSTAVGVKTFTRGFVAKVDLSTFKVCDAVEVGYEPEGIALYDDKLFVANSGGYASLENHDYEQTVSIINPGNMTIQRTVDTGQINLYGDMAQSGQYLCITSPGDYYSVEPATIIFDCQAALNGKPDADCFIKLNYAATYNTTARDGNFYALGSTYSYLTGGYEYDFLTINPSQLFESKGQRGLNISLPGSMEQQISAMSSPSCLYVNPYTGYIYATDAIDYTSAGYLYQWTPSGDFVGKFQTYIAPCHMLALNPHPNAAIPTISTPEIQEPMFNLQGQRISCPIPGQIYIQGGVKKIARH